MKEALKGEPVLPFATPADIVFAKIDPRSGLLAVENGPDVYLEAFKKGSEPSEFQWDAESRVARPSEDESPPAGGAAPSSPKPARPLGTATTAPLDVIRPDAEGGF